MSKAISTEAGLEAALVRLLKGWKKAGRPVSFFKPANGFYQSSGKSDRIVCYYGFYVAIELKKPGRITQADGSKKPFKPSSETERQQMLFINDVREAKGYGGFFDNLDDIIALFDSIAEFEQIIYS